MPNKGSFENEDLILDPIQVTSYGEVFRKIHKPKIRKRPRRDAIISISASEMKLQISQTDTKQKILDHFCEDDSSSAEILFCLAA